MNDQNKRIFLRSQEWFDDPEHADMTALYVERYMNYGLTRAELQSGRPIIGIAQTGSDLTPCNRHHKELAERVKAGIRDAGGIPMEFPVHPIAEQTRRPTAALDRNLAYLGLVEILHGYPLDGVVLTTGCDKTTPALLMGAASCDIPAIVVTGGPMLNGKHKGKDIGAGTIVWQMHEELKAGKIDLNEFLSAESGMSRSAGTCNTMGTASTMACMAEALGTSLPHNAAIPAVDSRRYVLAHLSGMRIVDMVHEDLRLSKILTKEAFENAIKVNAAIGGSTNAVIHLKAIAGRIGVDLQLDDWNRVGRGMPTIVDLQPSGRFLMEEFYYSGGLPAVIRRMGEANLLPHPQALTVNGQTIWENCQQSPIYNDEVIRKIDNPIRQDGGMCILRGNLAPKGAVLKPSAATPELMKHRGRAVVFENFDDYKSRINDPDLDVDETCILVMKNAGPKGYPGMAEVGNMGLPPKILAKGITDMVRISDARMSGTAYGTVVLHVAPEAMAGGPLAVVQNGDFIELDAYAGKLHLEVSDEELKQRLENLAPPAPPSFIGGYRKLYVEHVLQADEGCDFDFLVGCRGSEVPRHSH
ncbi:IlvD/Edd family dehydratase [Acinetobacter baumannii]|nr:IlvD/Edd family dehydratase [Acinetobacter baumannii]EXD18589.1 dehydratase family protein [Acinetobacter baumannii 1297]